MRKYLFIIIALVLAGGLSAQTVKDLEKQRKQLERQLEQTDKMLKQTKKNETATINKLNLTNKEISTRAQLISTINTEIVALDIQLQSLSKEKVQLLEELDSLRNDYAHLIRQTHYLTIHNHPLLFVLSADNFKQMFRRIRYLQEFAAYRKAQVAAIEKKQSEIDDKNMELQANKDSKETVLKSRKREQTKLQSDQRKQHKMLQDLKKKEKELLAQQKKQQKKADELNKKIDQLIQKEVKKSSSKLTAEQKLVAGGFEKNKGKLPWPTEKGIITGEFGVHKHPTLPNIKVNNTGIYIQTTVGAMARTVYEGVVTAIFVADNKYVIIVQHGNYRTVYSNLSKVLVKQGDKVKTKQQLGQIYTDPQDDNKTEIFFQVRRDTDVLDPAVWLAD